VLSLLDSDDEWVLEDAERRRAGAGAGAAGGAVPDPSSDEDVLAVGGAGRPHKRARMSPEAGAAPPPRSAGGAAASRAALAEQKRQAKAAAREAKAAARASEKAASAAARQAQRGAAGKFAHQELTAFLDARLASTAAGRALGAAMAAAKFSHAVGELPVEHSVLWVRHPPQEGAWEGPLPWAGREARAAAQRAGALEVPYVLLLLDPARAVAAAEAGGDGEGLLRLCRRVRDCHASATLCLLTFGLAGHLRARELREYDPAAPRAGFRPAAVEAALARLVTHLRGVRQRDARDEAAAAEHAALLTESLAQAPYRAESSFLVLFAAERKVQRAYDQPAGDPDGAVGGEGEAAAPPPRRELSLEAAWVASLASIPACSADAATAIARAYPSAAALARAYRAPGLSAKAARELLKDVHYGGGGAGAGGDAPKSRRVGPAVSERLWKIFQPRERSDLGSEFAV